MMVQPLITREVVARIRSQQVDLSRSLDRVVELCQTARDRNLCEYVLGLQGALRCHADRVDAVLRRTSE